MASQGQTAFGNDKIILMLLLPEKVENLQLVEDIFAMK